LGCAVESDRAVARRFLALQDLENVQDLAAIAQMSSSHHGRSSVLAKVQGPFEGHNMTAGQELVYSQIVVCAGGIGATAVLPMLVRAAMRRGVLLQLSVCVP
jgi:hypothetical protein